MSRLKERLYEELETKAFVSSEGVTFDPAIFKHLHLGSAYLEQVHTLFETDTDTHEDFDLPPCFILPNGLYVGFNYNRKSPHRIEYDGRNYFLLRNGRDALPISFLKRPAYYARQTADGTDMRTVATWSGHGAIFVAYSNECSLKRLFTINRMS